LATEHAEQEGERQEREGVPRGEAQGHVEGVRREDQELAERRVAAAKESDSSSSSKSNSTKSGTTAQKRVAGRKSDKTTTKKL